jgi:hypothetical protein
MAASRRFSNRLIYTILKSPLAGQSLDNLVGRANPVLERCRYAHQLIPLLCCFAASSRRGSFDEEWFLSRNLPV